KGYITFIHFRLLIDHIEDPFCTCKCHDNGVELLCYLHKRLGKAFCKLEIGRHDAERDSAYSCHGEKASEYCCEYKLQVPDISDDRSHHVCKCIRIGCAVVELFVQPVKLFFRYPFMVEHFDDSLPIHSLLHKPGHISEGDLLS